MTSKYRERDKRADGSYAFEWLSRYFDVIHWLFCAAPLKVERAYLQMAAPIHTKHDNDNDSDKDIVLKIVLSIKE